MKQDATHSPRMLAFALAAAALLLVPTLFYPIGPDQGMFLLGGEKILRGAIHYRDIVDVKPPAIYYIYAGIAATLGTSELAIRIFDLLVQLATVGMIVLVVRRISGDDRWAATAAVCYGLFYLLQEYQSTAQVESFVGLIGLAILHLLLTARSARGYLAIGLAAGLLFLLKFTLGIMLAVAMLAEIVVFGARGWRALRPILLMGAGFLLPVAALLLYLSANDAVHGFLLMQEFTRGYVTTLVPSAGAWMKSLFEILPHNTGEFYSILFLVLTAAGIVRTVPLRGVDELALERPDAHRLARLCALSFLLLLASLTVEGKYYSYHFIRLYAFGAILVPLGLFALLRAMARSRVPTRIEHGYGRLAAALLLALILLFSPLPRDAWHLAPMVLTITGGSDRLDRHYDTRDGQARVELKEVGREVRRHLGPGDRMFAAAATGSLVYYFSGEVPEFKIFHSAFIVAPFAPQEWRDSTRAWVLRTRPAVIVLQRHDNRSDQNGVMTSSRDAFLALPGIRLMLESDYRTVYTTDSYDVLRRN